jgi:hypothetical protein
LQKLRPDNRVIAGRDLEPLRLAAPALQAGDAVDRCARNVWR